MSIKELSSILRDKYNNAYKGEFVAQIHLFGIEYGKLIRDNSYTSKDIINDSGLQESYIAELNKGIKLSNCVSISSKELSSNDLGSILKHQYETAKKNSQVASIYMFGIEYGHYIRFKNISLSEIIVSSGLMNSYLTELHKGVKLSKFVKV